MSEPKKLEYVGPPEPDDVLIDQVQFLLEHRYAHKPPIEDCALCARARRLAEFLLRPFA